ncbi:MAG: hypothetical protein Q9181_007179 [Wetmoreana brouardii]
MPMMMDDELDDLFGDQQLGDVSHLENLSSIPRGLDQRIDDLRITQLQFPRPAAKAPNGQWAFAGSRLKLTGPHNPHVIGEQPSKNKAAFVTVTRNAVIRLIYQGPDAARWLDFKGELDTVSTADDLLTHVAICADKGVIQIKDRQELLIDFISQIYWPAQRFVIEHLKTIEDLQPTDSDLDEATLPPSLPHREAQLYHLKIVSPGPHSLSKETLPPLLLAFFCNVPYQGDPSPLGIETSTSIVRWELSSVTTSLHPSFSQLASKKPNAKNPGDLQVRQCDA